MKTKSPVLVAITLAITAVLSSSFTSRAEEKPVLLASIKHDVEKPPLIINPQPQRQQSNASPTYTITIVEFRGTPLQPVNVRPQQVELHVLAPVDAVTLWARHQAKQEAEDRHYVAQLAHLHWDRIAIKDPMTAWDYTGMDTVPNGPDAQTDVFTYPIPGVPQSESWNFLLLYRDKYPTSPRSPCDEDLTAGAQAKYKGKQKHTTEKS